MEKANSLKKLTLLEILESVSVFVEMPAKRKSESAGGQSQNLIKFNLVNKRGFCPIYNGITC